VMNANIDSPDAVLDHTPAESAVPESDDTPSETPDSTEPVVVGEEQQPPGDGGGLPDSISTQVELTTENREANATGFETQAAESKEEKEGAAIGSTPAEKSNATDLPVGTKRQWKLCSFEGAQDFIPCLDNEAAIKKLTSRKHYEHRERHCFSEDALPKCLLPLPANYKAPIPWPTSRDQVKP
jgi:hypothetical protein